MRVDDAEFMGVPKRIHGLGALSEDRPSRRFRIEQDFAENKLPVGSTGGWTL
jgi:hypothetical protein